MTLSHSLRRDSRRFGNELALGGLGGAPPDAATAIKSASVRGVLVTGHKLDVRRCARIVRFSNSCPVVLDTTGSLGTSPLMAQNMAFGAFGAKSGGFKIGYSRPRTGYPSSFGVPSVGDRRREMDGQRKRLSVTQPRDWGFQISGL
eukprot:scaffold16_cov242-Pinguiococcus_pyrenoidosus.AAC.9